MSPSPRKRLVYDRTGKAHSFLHRETEDEREIRMAKEGREEYEEPLIEEPPEDDEEEIDPEAAAQKSAKVTRHRRRKSLLKEKALPPFTEKELRDRLGKRAVKKRMAREKASKLNRRDLHSR